jgi:dephospho-CoA kinase
MLRVGLTGGIACGKSTVVSMLRDFDCQVLEADPLVHELLEPGQGVYDEVVAEFGGEILDAEGKVDRKKLGAIVFPDVTQLFRLNKIIHPRVLDIITQWFVALDRPGGPDFAIAEAALMIESGFAEKLDRIIVVWCKPEQQRERLRHRGLNPEQIEQRIEAQMPIDEKRQVADDVIDASGTIEETEAQVKALAAKLAQLAAASRSA